MKEGFNPYKFLLTIFLVVSSSLILTLFVRGFIAKKAGVFYYSDVKARLPIDIQKKINEQDSLSIRHKASVKFLDSRIDSLLECRGDEKTITALIDIKNKITDKENDSKVKIKVLPFYLDLNTFLWSWLYICFGLIIFLLNPSKLGFKGVFQQPFKLLMITTLLFVSYRWPTYFRNFILNTEAQTIFAAANYSVSHFYFYTQEVIIFILFILLSIIILQNVDYYYEVVSELNSEKLTSQNCVIRLFNPITTERLSNIYRNWQITSVLLSLGFVFYSETFWKYVIQYNDFRYLPSAVIIHSIWVIVWIIISIPLLHVWHNWHLLKLECKESLQQQNDGKNNSDLTLQMIDGLQPIPSLNITVTSLTALISFLLPIVNSLHK